MMSKQHDRKWKLLQRMILLWLQYHLLTTTSRVNTNIRLFKLTDMSPSFLDLMQRTSFKPLNHPSDGRMMTDGVSDRKCDDLVMKKHDICV